MSALLAICFFACSAVCWLHVYQVVRDKQTRGVSLIPSYVFITTNVVEIFYFWNQLDTWSAIGAASMGLSNVVWLGCAVWFRGRTTDILA